MGYFKQNPRRSIITGCYILAFVLLYMWMGLSLAVMAAVYVLIAVVFTLIYIVDTAALYGNICYIKGNKKKAEKYLRFSIIRNTKNANAYLAYATMYMERSQGKEAEPLLEKAHTLCKNSLYMKNIQLTRAACQWQLGNIDKAIEILEEMRKTYEYVNDRVLSTLGYMYYLKGDLVQSEKLNRQSLEDNPHAYAAWDNLGQLFLKKNDLTQAKEAFLKALECKADLPDSLYHLGVIARQEGDEGQAAGYFNKALACNITGLNGVKREEIEGALG